MSFKERLKRIRKDNGLTQEEFANSLNVTRQAVSNWENNKNLPDIEIIIDISKKYDVSLDDLLKEENIETKVVKDSRNYKNDKLNIKVLVLGFISIIIGIVGILIKSLSVEYIDTLNILHEKFFLLPISFFFLLQGFILFVMIIIINLKKNNIFLKVGIIIIVIMTLVFGLLIQANS